MDHAFKYTPDTDLKVHEEGAIKLICAFFQSHEAGLPEWVKNSADAYARADLDEARRVVVVCLQNATKTRPASISCLDFVGMSSDEIDQHFRHWGAPDASSRGAGPGSVQGGHGNGGKCYMTQMFADYALLHTYRDGKACQYGVSGGKIRFGYIPNKSKGKDIRAVSLKSELTKALGRVGIKPTGLPSEVERVVKDAAGFTLVSGMTPKGYEKRIKAKHLIQNLRDHSQMIRSLEQCRIYAVVNGKPWEDGERLVLPVIEPIPGEEAPREIEIPKKLKDPQSSERVSTTDNGAHPEGMLTLLTSDKRMTHSRAARHTINYRTRNGYIGYHEINQLDVQSPYRSKIYGSCRLDALEPFKQNDRGHLATAPLTRAVNAFIAREVQKYAEIFEARDKTKYKRKEKDAISKINEALDRWKNKFISQHVGAVGPDDGTPPPPPPLPSGSPARIEIALTHPRAGIGVSIRPRVHFFNREDKRIRAVPFSWVCDDTNVAMVDEGLGVITTFTKGTTRIWAQTDDGKLKSNVVELEVVAIQSITITPPEVEVPMGGRRSLVADCVLPGGATASDVALIWTESNPTVARVSANGVVFGYAIGETVVVAGDDKCLADSGASLQVIASTGSGRGKGSRGRGYPLVLVSGIDGDPDTDAEVSFPSDVPPVTQRPEDVDRNIWWINSAAPLARLYLDSSRGYGYETKAWRIYHVERYIEIIADIALINNPSNEIGIAGPSEWVEQWGSTVSRIQEAAVEDLADFISDGDLPSEGDTV